MDDLCSEDGKRIYNKQGRAQGGVGVKTLLVLIFKKTLLPAQKRLIVFTYFLLVNLSTNRSC